MDEQTVSEQAANEEYVVLMDEQRQPIGAQPKRLTHHRHTPLHLGFSCYVLNPAGELLVTQRAWSKPTFGGVWTNTLCGHPAPGEADVDAVARRAAFELGMTLTRVEPALPHFRYRAEQNGVVENEWCPVFLAATAEQPEPNPDEVGDASWISWETFVDRARTEPQTWSPWCREQAEQLDRLKLMIEFRAHIRRR